MALATYGSATKFTNTDCSFLTLITNHVDSRVDGYWMNDVYDSLVIGVIKGNKGSYKSKL